MSTSPAKCGCGEEIEPERLALGIYICLECGEERANRRKQMLAQSTVPMHKGNYILITNKNELKQLDPKHKL